MPTLIRLLKKYATRNSVDTFVKKVFLENFEFHGLGLIDLAALRKSAKSFFSKFLLCCHTDIHIDN
ncbi:hypothetical protein T10_7349 [Trichinella papuae]|uniref:Uncharacterized protein n=1 Tax=Trichinella papuae TaxID=268474 RepID=A0A0V1M8W3_9BILA|nr:hypothetical protein T10_7349 [Trichinella papuae]